MATSKMYDAEHSPNERTNPGDTTTDPEKPTTNDFWLTVARDAFIQSESYFEANIRFNLERNFAHFANRHAPGSKYHGAAYKHRHKGFRPKTRSMVRKSEANAAVAMFSTSQALHVKPARSGNKSHQVSAEINQQLIQYRFDNTIPWYLTALGSYQETLVAGTVISHQYWNYERVETKVPNINDAGELELGDDDMPVYGSEYVVVKDTPACELRPIENVFFSTAADWTDPINSSPFLIDKIAMYIDDVLQMSDPNNPSRIPWLEVTEAMLLVGATTDYDSIRRQREANREDSKDQVYLHRGFDTVWVHRNIIRKDGRDWLYYTLEDYYRLSDPIPLEEAYPHLKMGERPYVMGFSNFETHKNYPESLVGLSAPTQQEANEINNQRRDNVALVLNRRYFVRRQAMIDYGGLQRNVPGGVTEVDNVDQDIKSDAPPEVTQSSYQEQDRVNMDFDEQMGHFSSSSVGSNRQLNETVGGMELLSANADVLSEYPLRTWVETWVKPVIKQLIRLEQYHESDQALLNLIGEKMKMWQKYGVNKITDAWIQGSMNIEIGVGFGSTDPNKRVNRLAMGLGTLAKFSPQKFQRLDGDELATEIFGAIGYPGSERFFPEDAPQQTPQGPQEGELTEQDQGKLDQEYTMHQEKMDSANQDRMAKLEMKYMDMELQQQKMLEAKSISEATFEANMAKIQTDRQNNVDKLRVTLEEMKIKRTQGSGI